MKNILKRTATVFLAALLLFTGLPAQKVEAAKNSPLYTSVTVTGKNDSQKVFYTLTLSKTKVTDGHIAVVYDPEVLEVAADIEIDRFDDYDLNSDYTDATGKGLAVAFVNDSSKTTSGALIGIKFNVKKGAAAQDTVITTRVFDLNNEETELIPVETDITDTVKVGRAELVKPTLKPLNQTLLGVNVTWSKDKNADGYIVYRSTSKDGKYTEIATTTATSFWDVALQNNKTYYYKVKAFQGKGSERVFSEESNVLSIKVKKLLGIFG